MNVIFGENPFSVNLFYCKVCRVKCQTNIKAMHKIIIWKCVFVMMTTLTDLPKDRKV